MDTIIKKTERGKDYNKNECEIVTCKLCKENKTIRLYTKLCDRCWGLDRRIGENFKLAKAIIKNIEAERKI